MKKRGKKQIVVGILFILLLGTVGCQPVTKDEESGIVTIQDQKQQWNKDSCASYTLERKEYDRKKLWKDFIKEDNTYTVWDYGKETKNGEPAQYTKTGKELLENPPKHFQHALTVGEPDSLTFVKGDFTMSLEEFCLYEYDEKEAAEELLQYETAVGTVAMSRVSTIDFLNPDWLDRELSFAKRADIAKKAVETLAEYGIKVSEDMDIYAITGQDIVKSYKKEWEAIKEVKDSDLDTDYAVDGYYVQAYITADGIRVVNHENAEVGEDEVNRNLPVINMYYTAEGLQYLEVRNYQQAGKRTKDGAVISYEKAMEILMAQYKGVQSDTDTYEYQGGRLEYLPMERQETVQLTPVWTFRGKRIRNMNKSKNVTDELFMVDAYTGKIIR